MSGAIPDNVEGKTFKESNEKVGLKQGDDMQDSRGRLWRVDSFAANTAIRDALAMYDGPVGQQLTVPIVGIRVTRIKQPWEN